MSQVAQRRKCVTKGQCKGFWWKKEKKKKSIQLALVMGQEEGQVEHRGWRAFRCFNQLKALSSPIHSEWCPSATVESRPADTVVTIVLEWTGPSWEVAVTGSRVVHHRSHSWSIITWPLRAAHRCNCGHDCTHSRECHARERPKCRTFLQQKLT